MWYVWLICAGIFFIAEMLTVGFLIFWLGISAIIAMLVSFITDNIFIQTLIFVLSSCILIPFTKPLTNKFIDKNDNAKTNAFSLINKKGVVITRIAPNVTGQVKVDGQCWSAITENNDTIIEGTEISVLKIDGVKLIVSPINETIKA